ncbi:MAG: NAD(P)-dependent dehydrogenase (short-subunit alcohol dehydrogenase family) [Myxococcota bacterium]|jgi:NAD(P)-dependent dehydrogenase (short-subunit alcohol dehydrogenase family)
MGPELSFEDRVVLVTGGTRGIGRGIAERFLAAGATVHVCSRKPVEQLPAAEGRQAQHHACDLREPAAVEALMDAIIAASGRLDVVINNAGGSPWAEAATASPRFSEKIIALNLLAPLYVSQQAHRVMTPNGGGAIVNIASVSGVRPSPGTAAYGAAKAGLLNLTQTLGVEWAGVGIRVNAIVCGLVETEQTAMHYGDAEGVARVAATVPMGRMATPGDVGNACLFLAHPLSGYVTGAALELHGGGEWPAFLAAART